MKRSPELTQLLTDLKAERIGLSLGVSKDTRMVITFEDESQLEFNGEECQMLLANEKTIDRLYEALDYPEETFIELYAMPDLDPDLLDHLASWASTVDEM